MTVETSDRKQTFTGGQGSLTFAFRTLVSKPEYIKVKLVTAATSEEVDLTYITDFNVSINSDGVGGVVTVSPSYGTAYNYVVYRETSAKQESAYDDFNQFPAGTVENDFDRTILIAQEQQEETGRTLRYPISESGASTELPVPLANAFLQWNAAADALINSVIPDPSTLVKATTGEAQAGVQDTHFMTPAKTADAIAALSPAVSSSTTDISVVGSVITLNSGTDPNQIVKLNGSSQLPKVDGSLLTNVKPIYVLVENAQSQNVDGGATSTGSFNDLILNTKTTDQSSIASLSSNHVTLPAGTYIVRGFWPVYMASTGVAATQLYDVTNAAILIKGPGRYVKGDVNMDIPITGLIVLSGSAALAWQYRVSVSHAQGQGIAGTFNTEHYAQLEFIKIA